MRACPIEASSRRACGFRPSQPNDCVGDEGGRGRTWLGEVGDDADGVGNALQARVRGAKALPLGRRDRLVHRHGVVAAAADLVVLLLPHIHELKPIDAPASLG